jgi:hypothetical protein
VQSTSNDALQRGQPDPQSARADVERYRSEVEGLIVDALAQGKSYALLGELCAIAPHRLAGSPGAQRAVEWGLDAMRRCGLVNVRAEPIRVPHWVRGERELLFVLDAHGLPSRTLTIRALGGSIATPPEGLTAEVIEIDSWDELKDRAEQVRGKIVFFNRPMDVRQTDCFEAYGGAVDQRGSGAVEAAKVGALAALVRSVTMRDDDFPHTGSLRYAADVAKVPSAALSTRAADQLSAQLARGERVTLNLQLSSHTLSDVESFNVVGEIVGGELPEEVLVVGGHLDAWDVGQGAHDDGAGCVHALEAARLIVARGLKPRRTIRVVLSMNEENGVRGGTGYFAAHAGEKHVLALESDAGGFTPRGFSTDANPSAFAQLNEIVALLASSSATALIEGHGGTDIGALAKNGVVLIGFRPDDERYFDFHHSDRDVLEAVHPRELALGAGAIAGLLYVAADMPHGIVANPPTALAPKSH